MFQTLNKVSLHKLDLRKVWEIINYVFSNHHVMEIKGRLKSISVCLLNAKHSYVIKINIVGLLFKEDIIWGIPVVHLLVTVQFNASSYTLLFHSILYPLNSRKVLVLACCILLLHQAIHCTQYDFHSFLRDFSETTNPSFIFLNPSEFIFLFSLVRYTIHCTLYGAETCILAFSHYSSQLVNHNFFSESQIFYCKLHACL